MQRDASHAARVRRDLQQLSPGKPITWFGVGVERVTTTDQGGGQITEYEITAKGRKPRRVDLEEAVVIVRSAEYGR